MGGLFFRQLIGVDGMVVRCGRTSSMAQLAYTAVVCCVGGLLLLSLAKSGQDSHLVVGECVCVCVCVYYEASYKKQTSLNTFSETLPES